MGAIVPDATFTARDLASAEDTEMLERALTLLEFVDLVNVDSERGLVAVSYEGGEAGHAAEPSPGADPEVD